MKRAALYLRVSRDDLSLDNQRLELEAMCRRRELQIVRTYEEQESAAARDRPVHDRMLVDAHAGAFDVVVVWALDRLGRSMFGNIQDVLKLDACGVHIVSAQEQWLDTVGPVRQLLVAIFSWVAQQERERMIERTKAGMDRARAQGKTIGRKKRVTPELEAEIAKRLRDDWTIRDIAIALKLPKATVYRSAKEIRARAVPQGGSKTGGPQVPEMPSSGERLAGP